MSRYNRGEWNDSRENFAMSRRLAQHIGIAVCALAVALTIASVASACPNCKEAMERQDPSHGGIVKGYFYSILFMMGTPYLVFGTFCGVMYYRLRRARVAKSGARPEAPAVSPPSQAGRSGAVAERLEV